MFTKNRNRSLRSCTKLNNLICYKKNKVILQNNNNIYKQR